jgi:hypothetical protein
MALILKRASQSAHPASATMTITWAATATITTESPTHDCEPTVEQATDAA